MFSLSEVPSELRCPDCGHYIKDLSQDEAFEILTARLLEAKVASANTADFDIYDSELFPQLTFQVKISNVSDGCVQERDLPNGRTVVFNQSPTWNWSERTTGKADIYVLYGIADELVYCFVAPLALWIQEASSTGNGGQILRISINEFSRRGRHFRQNKFWQHRIQSWPSGLFTVIRYYADTAIPAQEELFVM